ncbi:hypothetical protein BD779DRAFT_1668966 [Infundibulicybe gibba]|nr:hypothetical protein BD779DRAFT_1668966 [Infundibulicybe gibba]
MNAMIKGVDRNATHVRLHQPVFSWCIDLNRTTDGIPWWNNRGFHFSTFNRSRSHPNHFSRYSAPWTPPPPHDWDRIHSDHLFPTQSGYRLSWYNLEFLQLCLKFFRINPTFLRSNPTFLQFNPTFFHSADPPVPSTAVLAASKSPSHAPAIAGATVGAVVFLILCALAVFLFIRRRRNHTAPSAEFLNDPRTPPLVVWGLRPPSLHLPSLHLPSPPALGY